MAYSNETSNLRPGPSSMSEPWHYSMEFGQDGVWFDPPLGSPELTRALSYHFPPPEPTLERIMQVNRYWKGVDRNNNLKPSSSYHKGAESSTETMEVREDSKFSKTQPESSLSVAAPASNASLSHAVQPISFVIYEPPSDLLSSSSISTELQAQASSSKRYRRRLEAEERKRVAESRGHACAKHRRRHQTCDPEDCPDHGMSVVKSRKNRQRVEPPSLALPVTIPESRTSTDMPQQIYQNQDYSGLVPPYNEMGAGPIDGNADGFAIPWEIHNGFQENLPDSILMGHSILPPSSVHEGMSHQSLSYPGNSGQLSMGETHSNTSSHSGPWSSEVPQFMSTWQGNNSTTYPAVITGPEFRTATNMQTSSTIAAISADHTLLGGQSQQYFLGAWNDEINDDPFSTRSAVIEDSEDSEREEKPRNMSLSHLFESLKDTAKSHILKYDQDLTYSESRTFPRRASQMEASCSRSIEPRLDAQSNELAPPEEESPARKEQEPLGADEYVSSSEQHEPRSACYTTPLEDAAQDINQVPDKPQNSLACPYPDSSPRYTYNISSSAAPLQDFERDNVIAQDKAGSFLNAPYLDSSLGKHNSSRSRSAAPPSSSRAKNVVNKPRDSLAPPERSSSSHRHSSHRSRSVVPEKARQNSGLLIPSPASSHQSSSPSHGSRSSSSEEHLRLGRSQHKEPRKERHSSWQRQSSSRRPAHRNISRVKGTSSRGNSGSRSPSYERSEREKEDEGLDVVSGLADVLDRTLELFD